MSSERNITENLESNSGESVQSDNSDQLDETKTSENENPKEEAQEKSETIIPEDSSSLTSENSDPSENHPPDKQDQTLKDHHEDDHDHNDDHNDDHDHESATLEIDKMGKQDILNQLEEVKKWDNLLTADKRANLLKVRMDEIADAEKSDALEKFIEEGGDENSFEFVQDDLTVKFEAIYRFLKDEKRKYLRELDSSREKNYEKAQQTLEKLREFADSDESSSSFTSFKEIQKEWREIGPLPRNQVKTLWANYNALVNLFYDKRSIYFELKELDRKKNLEAKVELCKRAETLVKEGNLKKAIVDLNELHHEFKHIGPVPMEEQEALWTRFKAASDEIYARRKEYYHNFKETQKENLAAKETLIRDMAQFSEFTSGSIKEWNQKTKEIIEFQKKWEAIGSIPREKSRDINKQFWSLFKEFFKKKSNFFKELEGMRDDNLKLKQELISKASELTNGDDIEKAAEEIKNLQKKWKEVGPVPEKQRQKVFEEFKKVCDEFFEKRRVNHKEVQKQYEDNLARKKEIIAEINKLSESDSVDLDKLDEFKEGFEKIGFVPRNAINSVRKEFTRAVESLVRNSKIDENKKEEILIETELSQLKNNPNSGKKLQHREHSLRKQIHQIEDEINRMKTNMEYFAESKQAEIFKEQFNQKISTASEELSKLKKQLKILRASR